MKIEINENDLRVLIETLGNFPSSHIENLEHLDELNNVRKKLQQAQTENNRGL